MAASDTEAIGVLEAASDQGLSVPDDLSVIGYDDVEASDLVGLTTVRQPLAESGEHGVARLLELIDGKEPEQLREVLPVNPGRPAHNRGAARLSVRPRRGIVARATTRHRAWSLS